MDNDCELLCRVSRCCSDHGADRPELATLGQADEDTRRRVRPFTVAGPKRVLASWDGG